MALTPHPRKFKLVVTEVDITLNTRTDETWVSPCDQVEIEFAGKVFPSTQHRIVGALADGEITLCERRLA
jgi:hypothetical protein